MTSSVIGNPQSANSTRAPEQVHSAVGACCRNSAVMLRLADDGNKKLNDLNVKQAELLFAAADIADLMRNRLRDIVFLAKHGEPVDGKTPQECFSIFADIAQAALDADDNALGKRTSTEGDQHSQARE